MIFSQSAVQFERFCEEQMYFQTDTILQINKLTTFNEWNLST